VTAKVNLAAKLASFSEHFSPKIVAELNDYKIAVVKAKGEFVWHTHPDTDDFFLVLSGHLTIQLRDRDVGARARRPLCRGARRRELPQGHRRGARPPDRAQGHSEHG
jgi:hypothetical protein